MNRQTNDERRLKWPGIIPCPVQWLVHARHGRELMGCKSLVCKPMVCIDVINATRSTSRWQGRFREEWSEGSRMAHVRTDEQKSHRRLSLRASWHDTTKPLGFRRQGKCGGGARKVHVLIRGDLSSLRQGRYERNHGLP
ncbi:MAG: hypothetical protein A4E63_02278 [Syntrophorhabdus sp. PtaU1.Bin050]|nr:MAG: hypothetical protein A4E63_02278 [Syntrophorhabdus sp. PtaU1.Bin050]